MNVLKILTLIVAFNVFGFSQAISSDFYSSQYLSLLLDWGNFWDINTMFKPYYWQALSTSNSKGIHETPAFSWLVEDIENEVLYLNESPILMRIIPGINATSTFNTKESLSHRGITISSYALINMSNNIYLHIYPRLTTNPKILNHFSGIPRKIRRFGFNSGEYDMSAIGFRNNWVTIEIGRGRQNWGAISQDNLALSSNSAPYDYGLVEGKIKNVTMRYFHGFLESVWDKQNYNRYILGRGIEYSNKQNIILSVVEIVIYSGIDRPVDLSYINPLHTHLEVEFNKRNNRQDTNYSGSNAVWQISGDFFLGQHFRLSGNFLIDEYVIDKFELDEGQRSSTAYQIRLAYSTIVGNSAISISGDYTRVGSYTFRHASGYNNFYSRTIPLGTNIGSDGDKFNIGTIIITPYRLLIYSNLGILRSGERSIEVNPYEDLDQFTQIPFPSGNVQYVKYGNIGAQYKCTSNLEFILESSISYSKSGNIQNEINLSINKFLPIAKRY